MAAFDGLTSWAKDRPRAAAGIGGGFVVLVVVGMLTLGGGTDVAPVVGGEAAPAPQGTAAADGTVVADQGTAAAQSTQATAPVDEAAPGVAPIEVTASADDRDAAYANEQVMNANLPPAGGLDASDGAEPLSSPPETSEDVAFVGRKLELAADAVEACLDGDKGDVFDCLREMPEGIHVERIYETKPQGARISVTGAGPIQLMFRGGTRCRTLNTSPDCNAWTATSD